MNTRTKQTLLSYVLVIFLPLIVGGLVTLLLLLPKKESMPKENYEVLQGTRFDYSNNIHDKNHVEAKWLQFGCNDDGSWTLGYYYDVIYIKDGIVNYDYYYIDNFTLNGKEIIINFEKDYGSVHGTFNDDWTSITFHDGFPPLYYFTNWRFDICEKS